MIEAKHLTKIFKSKHKEKCIAINDVSFKLPDTGFVFAIGKSGSGKTTLLSLIGTLESITSGDILVDGVSLKSLNLTKQAQYRNKKIGFVFQDYHLLDQLTIKENISISLDIDSRIDDKKVDDVLNELGLSGYGDRYPKELSGGEKQRVAIARSLIKNPDIILADEPTGNLDSKTSEQVLTLLKEASKNHLVIIVSHNLQDAEKYADLILELHEGKLINEFIRNKDFTNEATIKDNTLLLPLKNELTNKEVNSIKENISKIDKIIKNNEVFVNKTQEFKNNSKDFKLEKSKFNTKKKVKLSFKFLKQKLISVFAYSFLISMIAVILGLSESLYKFDENKVLENELLNINDISYSLQKNKRMDFDDDTAALLIPVEEDDLTKFKDVYKDGNIYELVNNTLYTEQAYNSKIGHKFEMSPLSLYPMETRGTLICDEDFLIKKYGVNNKLEYRLLADEIKDYGVYITDYFADAMLSIVNSNTHLIVYHSDHDLVGNIWDRSNSYIDIYINGIIKTNYKERYKDIISKYKKNQLDKKVYKELTKDENYQNFVDEVMKYLSVDYSFNKNFKEDYKNSNSLRYFSTNAIYDTNNDKFTCKTQFYVHNDISKDLKGNEIKISSTLYESLGKPYETDENGYLLDDVEFKVKFPLPYDAIGEKPYYERTFKLLQVVDYFSYTIFPSLEGINEIAPVRDCTFEYYFDNLGNINEVTRLGKSLGYKQNSARYLTLETMTKSVAAFKDVFLVIYIVLAISVVALLIGFGIKTIKSRIYEIGVLKALGTKDSDLIGMFSLNIIFLSLITTILYAFGSFIFLGLFNNILSESLITLTDAFVIRDVKFLYFDAALVGINIGFIILITILTFIAIMIALRKIKPIKIIKAKE